MTSRHAQGEYICVLGGGVRYEFLFVFTVLLFRLFKIPADCRRFHSHRPTWRSSTVSSSRCRACELGISKSIASAPQTFDV